MAGVQAQAAAPPAGRPASGAAAGGTLEAQVGVKWVGWAGAILVVIGAALLIKYAYDQKWFGSLPPAARLALMSLGGFGLIAAGEVVFRRVGALAAAGLFAAGVATLFVVSYAGHRYLGLYERNVSFVLMSLVTLVGAGVAVRGNLVSIAALSIVGGNVAPLILAGDDARLLPLLAYLLMLQVVALVLSWWGRGPKWWALRGLALATICLWMAVPVVAIDELPAGERGAVLTFALLYAALFHAELVLSALRPVVGPAYAQGFAVPVPLGARSDAAGRRGLGVTFGLLVTAALTVAVLAVFHDAPRLHRGAWTVGIGACCLALGAVLPRLVRRRRADPSAESPALALAVGYRIQAAALLVVAVPVTLSGVWVTVAWAALGAAFALAGARLNLSVSRVAGVAVWLLAVAHLGLWTATADLLAPGPGGRGPTAVWAVVLGEPIPAYAVLAAVMTLVGHAVAALVREDWTRRAGAHQPAVATESGTRPAVAEQAPRRAEAVPADGNGAHSLNYESRTAVRPVPLSAAPFQALATCADVAAVVVFLTAAAAALPALAFTAAVLCYGWALIAAERISRSPALLPAGLAMVVLATGKWLLFDTLGRWIGTGDAGGAHYRPVYNPTVAVGAALLVSGLALLRLPLRSAVQRLAHAQLGLRVGDLERAVRAVGGFAAVAVVLWGVTMEIDRYFDVGAPAMSATDAGRAKQVAVSIFWSVYAVACVALGFRLRAAGLRYFGLALFGFTALKVMAVDLSQVETGYRILSFLGLGVLLLGTSVLYGKLSPALLGEGAAREADAVSRSAG